mmetsp:Transcript_162976/g.395955  ORF Transcript_162976/g.395955 Transcript_162976/m.395955 type:complete len:221 (+) Transcript_162976:640-1302(+)
MLLGAERGAIFHARRLAVEGCTCAYAALVVAVLLALADHHGQWRPRHQGAALGPVLCAGRCHAAGLQAAGARAAPLRQQLHARGAEPASAAPLGVDPHRGFHRDLLRGPLQVAGLAAQPPAGPVQQLLRQLVPEPALHRGLQAGRVLRDLVQELGGHAPAAQRHLHVRPVGLLDRPLWKVPVRMGQLVELGEGTDAHVGGDEAGACVERDRFLDAALQRF